MSSTVRDGWTGRRGFLLATIGSAVGIGSIWKFPYEVGTNGGGSFVLVYLVGLAVVVVPLVLAEFAIGRRGGSDALTSLSTVARGAGRSGRWRWVGALGALAAFVILSYYAVIAGWTLSFAARTTIDGLPADRAAAAERFDRLLASPTEQVAWQAVVLVAVALVVGRGVQRGIEAAMKVLMPVLFAMLVALAVYAMSTGDVAAAARFLFVPEGITGRAVLDALGLGFFSIGVGLGLMITYAAYCPPQVGLTEVAVVSVLADTAISVISGLAVYPIVFAHGLDPASGPGLVFQTLPIALADLPGARVVAVAFFLLLFVAALASAVSMLEGFTRVLASLTGWGRTRSIAVGSVACFLVGLATVLSFNRWKGFHPLGWTDRFRHATVYDVLDETASNLLLPVGGLLVAVFAGWRLRRAPISRELGLGRRTAAVLGFALRWVVPAVIAVVSITAFVA